MPPRVGDEVTGTVTRTMAYGAFVDLGNGHTGLLHISELSRSYVRDVSAHVKTGQRVRVRVMDVDEQGRRISLSLKRAEKIKATGYERVVQLGGDWGHPWGDGEDAKFLDLGPRPLPGPHHWQPDPKLFEEWEDDDGKPIFREGGNIKQDDMDEDEEGRGNR